MKLENISFPPRIEDSRFLSAALEALPEDTILGLTSHGDVRASIEGKNTRIVTIQSTTSPPDCKDDLRVVFPPGAIQASSSRKGARFRYRGWEYEIRF